MASFPTKKQQKTGATATIPMFTTKVLSCRGHEAVEKVPHFEVQTVVTYQTMSVLTGGP